MKRVAVALALCLAFCVTMAQNRYATQRIEGMAKALGIDKRIAKMPDGDYRNTFAYASHPLHVVVDGGVVSHIGWSLPPHSESSRAHRFVERSSLEDAMYKADVLPVEWKCADEAFTALGSISAVLDSDPANITYTCANVQGRQYQASWIGKNGKVLCMVAFPIKYELLTGATMREMEADMFERLSSLGPCTQPMTGFGEPGIRKTDSDYITVTGPERQGSLLQNVVYLSPDSKEDSLKLIFDPQLPVESLANAISSTIASQGIEADVKMMMYGAADRSRSLSMPLSALVGAFLSDGCIPYTGLMEGSADGGKIALAVKMANDDMGYVHLLKVTADPAILFGPKPKVEVTLAAYVNDKPTQETIYE